MKIGFTIALADFYGSTPPRYRDIRRMAQRAEAHGFDSIWFYDHLLYRARGEPTRGIWECWSMLSALAEATERVQIGTLVVCNSFRNPALLAKMAHTVDEISDGRLILGLGAGWNKPEYDAFGYPFDHVVGRFEEAVQIIRPLLREGRTSFHGTYYHVDDCEITPRGPREAGPPLMIGASGPRMMRLTARYADLWNTAYTGRPETFEEPLAKFRAATVEVGREPDSIEATALANVVFGDAAESPGFKDGWMAWMSGTPEELARDMKSYEAMGTAHLMLHCHPYGEETFDALVAALDWYRKL